jgi:hypothetical protein
MHRLIAEQAGHHAIAELSPGVEVDGGGRSRIIRGPQGFDTNVIVGAATTARTIETDDRSEGSERWQPMTTTR